MRVRVYACMTEENRTHDNRKREDHQQAEKPEYIRMIADNEKKYKKSLKKFGNTKKPPYLCCRNQNQTTL